MSDEDVASSSRVCVFIYGALFHSTLVAYYRYSGISSPDRDSEKGKGDRYVTRFRSSEEQEEMCYLVCVFLPKILGKTMDFNG